MSDPRSRRSLLLSMLVPGALASAACADDAGTPVAFPAEPLVTVTGAQITIEARSGPDQPPVRGAFEVELAITDLAGAPVVGLVVEVHAWMPAMHHGSSATPTVTEEGSGIYHVAEVLCPMAGAWVLETDVAAPDGAWTERLTIPVQVR